MMQVFNQLVFSTLLVLSFLCYTCVFCTLDDDTSAPPELSTNEERMTTALHRIGPSHQHIHHIHSHNSTVKRYQVAKFDFEHVSTPYIISLWIIIVGLAKIDKSIFDIQYLMFAHSMHSIPTLAFNIAPRLCYNFADGVDWLRGIEESSIPVYSLGFHVTPKLSSLCPESVVLMVLGVIIGLIMFFAGIPDDKLQPLTPNLFFLYMLPPIVMDAGYHMPNRLFFDNLISILLYAVIGTVWNALAIGLSLWGCSQLGAFGGEPLPLLDVLLFSSTVSAVDPVAVLAVFEEIHVNEVLYILVFGESLLNDAVTVVLYHMFEGYAEMAYEDGIESVLPIDYLAGFASFFVISLGGTAMGVIWGFLAAFVSRFTHHVKIIEPVFVFVMAYLSYLSAEMFHLSGILSLTFCGITMKNYVEENITQKSHTTLKYAMKMLANSSEAIIFVFLGVCTVNDNHNWNTPFVVLTIIFCLIYRTIGVIALTYLANRFRLHRLTRVEQFIMAYGGLRGAVAFALILVINGQIIHGREMMVTTIIAVVYFTVFLQGMTVGSLVKLLNVPRANKRELTMNERIHTRLMDHIMAGLEDISGMMIGNYKLRDKFRHFNNNYLRLWLLRDSHEMGNNSRKIFETCSKLNLQEALNIVNKQNIYLNTNNNSNNNFLSPNKTLSALFRTYTQTNLANLATDDVSDTSPSTGIPSTMDQNNSFNFDIGNLAYSPSNKDLADAEIHHILTDAMFKPIKKVRRYSRSDVLEVPAPHPPFQHQMRLQIRHLITQQQHKHHKRKLKKLLKNESNVTTTPTSPSNGFLSPNSKNNLKLNINKDFLLKPDSKHISQNQLKSDSMVNNVFEDEEGIEFTVRKTTPEPSPQPEGDHSSHPLASTATESTLPWRRENSTESSAQVVRQEEFPPWIDNKDYMPYYASPTNTYLAKLSDQTKPEANGGHSSGQSTRTPTVYEIFTIDESKENGRSDSASSQGSRDDKQTKPESQTPEGVTRGRFHCTTASQTGQQLSPNVAINLGFDSEEESDDKEMVYKL